MRRSNKVYKTITTKQPIRYAKQHSYTALVHIKTTCDNGCIHSGTTSGICLTLVTEWKLKIQVFN